MIDHKIIDTPWRTTNRVAQLKAAGIETVIRYYNFQNSSKLPEKRLTLSEAEAISGAGLDMAVVFQARQNQIADFSKLKGQRAGERAFRYAADDIGQPEDSSIYFAVDFDASISETKSAIIPYFEGVRIAFESLSSGGPGYRVGCYGSGLVTRMLKEAGLIDLIWLSMSRGFRETREQLKAGEWDLNQIPPETKLFGLGIDYNEVNPNRPDFGAFRLDIDSGPISAPPSGGLTHKVIARSGLRLRAGPEVGFDILGLLPEGTQVKALSQSGDWVQIDRDGDGLADGYVFGTFLQPI